MDNDDRRGYKVPDAAADGGIWRKIRPVFGMKDGAALVFMAVLTVGLLGLCVQQESAHMAGGMYDYDDVVLRIDSGASKHFISNIDLFTSRDTGAKNLTFNTAAGTTITSRAVGTVKFIAFDDAGAQRIVTLDGA